MACVDGAVRLLRHGAIPREELEEALGAAIELASAPAGNGIIAPGALASHYAPRATLRLNATAARPGEAALDFAGALARSATAEWLDLSATGDLTEAAANLFAHLRALDAGGAPTIAAAPIPERGLGMAINDRLRRAAAPRPTDARTR